MKSEELLDKLNRVYLMEEEMSSVLLELCRPEVLPGDITEKVRKRIESILLSIKMDTLRHKKIVSDKRENLL